MCFLYLIYCKIKIKINYGGICYMDNLYMLEAMTEAKMALEKGEVPVGAVIVKNNEIVARAHNLKETFMDVTAHAEILAIKKASSILRNWRLTGCDMYVTLEPCPMCASAIAQARINRLYIGTFDPSAGGCGSVVDVLENSSLRYKVQVNWMYSSECSNILKKFFFSRRKEEK